MAHAGTAPGTSDSSQAFVKKHRRGDSMDATLARAAQLAREFAAAASGSGLGECALLGRCIVYGGCTAGATPSPAMPLAKSALLHALPLPLFCMCSRSAGAHGQRQGRRQPLALSIRAHTQRGT